MKFKTVDQLFPHRCQIRDMKFSSFNPLSISYYCTQCGGRLVIKLKLEDWPEFFPDNSLKLSKKILLKAEVLEEDEQDKEPAEEV
ncbi:MAG: hypothetical protein ACYCW6_08735 [Candidatus Xenobia bacterium]